MRNLRFAALILLGLSAACSSRSAPGPSGTTVTVPDGKGGAVTVDVPTCTRCHGDPARLASAATDPLIAAAPPRDASGATGTPVTGAHLAHLSDGAFARAIRCDYCHQIPSKESDHASRKVIFSGLTVTGAGTGATYTAGTLSCSSTYCHGNINNGLNKTVSWNGTSADAQCGSCHGLPPGGTHPASTNCGQCHDSAYTWNGSSGTVNLTMHVNGQVDLTNLNCSSCHGDPARVAVASATALDPLGANLVKAAPPVDAGHGTAATGAHQAHVNQGDAAGPGALSSALTCSLCHPVPSGLAHSDGAVQVAFSGIASASGAGINLGTLTCSSTYCHGNFTGGNGANPVVWTAAGKLGCTACHGAPPGPTSATVHHPPNPNCGSCHAGYGAGTVSAATHVDGAVQHAPATGCTQCHGDVTAAGVASTDVRAAPASNASALDAHGNAAADTSQRGVGAHQKHLTGTAWRAASIPCAECHSVPAAGDVTHADGTALVTFGALARTGGVTPTAAAAGSTVSCSSTYCHGNFTGGANATVTWNSPSTVVCGTCHGIPPAVTRSGPHPANNACATCHSAGYSTTTVDPLLHMNGQVEASLSEPAAPGTSCGSCHSYFNAMNGSVAKVSKHTLGTDSPADGAFDWSASGALTTAVAPASRSCVTMCHGDHPHDLTSPASATHDANLYFDGTTQATRANGSATRVGAGAGQNRARTDFDSTSNAGLCASCHQLPIAAGGITVSAATFGASGHDFTAAAGVTWTYQLHDGSLFARNCTKCHASRTEGNTPAVPGSAGLIGGVHYSDTDDRLLAGVTHPATVNGTVNAAVRATFVCYNCHGNGTTGADRSGKAIATQIARASTAGQSGHPADADAVHDSVAELAAAAFGNALGGAARHASCLDCHDPHEAKPTAGNLRIVGGTTNGNRAGPALQGAWGARFTGSLAAFTAPTAGNFTKATLVAGTDLEASLCFKCHSAFYGTLPTSPSGGFQETDQVKEFNPANAGFHPVLASNVGTLGNTANIKAPFSRTSLMACTDCHESDVTTDPNGPHGSAAKFLLKGPNTSWSNTVTNTSAGMPNGTFCINCHNQNYSGGRFANHTNGQHNIACMNCHAAVPHGGPRMGILVAPAGAAVAAGTFPGPVANWDTTPPYSNPGAGSHLYLKSYPTAAGSWSQANCGCNGTGH